MTRLSIETASFCDKTLLLNQKSLRQDPYLKSVISATRPSLGTGSIHRHGYYSHKNIAAPENANLGNIGQENYVLHKLKFAENTN